MSSLKLEMAFKVNKRNFCDICGSDSVGGTGNETVQVKKENPGILLPGCEGSLIFNEHLRVYFITTKLFKFSKVQFLETLPSASCSGRPPTKRKKTDNDDDGESFQENLLYGNICTKCEDIVDEALGHHGKILELQKKIDKLGETLLEWKEIREQGHFKDSSNQQQQETQQKMLDLSLACLSGLNTKRKEKKKPEPFRKPPARTCSSSRRSASAKTAYKVHCELESDVVDSLESTPEPSAEDDDDDIDYMPDNEDDLENDELYIPSASTDEEIDHDTDEDYIPEADIKSVAVVGKTRKKNRKALITSEDDDASCDNENTGKGVTKEHLNTFPSASTTTKFELQCPECLRVFHKRQSLHNHTRNMHGFDMHYSCPKCPDVKFLKKRFLTEHRNKVHGIGSECDICGKRLTNRKGLFQHYDVVHKIKYPCPFCNKKFNNRLALHRHRKSAHVLSKKEMMKLPERIPKTEEEKAWASNPCTECGRIFISGDKFDAHLKKGHEYKLTPEQRVKLTRKCYFCWKVFCLEQRHWIHCKTVHPEIKIEFPCDGCSAVAKNVVFQTVPELEKHLESEHSNSPIYTCSQCKKPFLEKRALKSHVEIHVNKKPVIPEDEKDAKCPFKCWFCWELFKTEEARQRHLKVNKRHWKLKVEFPCDDFTCEHNQNTFTNLQDLKTHLSSNAHNNQNLFTCERCSWSFLSKEMLDIHKLNHIPRIKEQFTCPICSHMSGKLSSLKDHYNLEHGFNLMLYKCTYCDKRFRHKRAQSSHQSQAHEKPAEEIKKEAELACHKCGKLFISESRLKIHLHQSHTGFKCSICGLEFETLSKYHYHTKMVHSVGVQHLCAVCGKVCISKILLADHMKVHSAGYKRFECHLCGRKMNTLDILKTHIQKVHEETTRIGASCKFVCLQCGKGYGRKDTLSDHIRVNHTQDTTRVWSCDNCGKRFKRKGFLDSHLKNSRGCHKSVTLMEVTQSENENCN